MAVTPLRLDYRLAVKPRRSIIVTTSFEGFHFWNSQEAPNYLRREHRHLFHVKLTLRVHHSNRDSEFFDIKRDIDAVCRCLFGANPQRPSEIACFSLSCEMMAELLAIVFNAERVEVWEDNENGGVFEASQVRSLRQVCNPFIGIECEGMHEGRHTLFIPFATRRALHVNGAEDVAHHAPQSLFDLCVMHAQHLAVGLLCAEEGDMLSGFGQVYFGAGNMPYSTTPGTCSEWASENTDRHRWDIVMLDTIMHWLANDPARVMTIECDMDNHQSTSVLLHLLETLNAGSLAQASAEFRQRIQYVMRKQLHLIFTWNNINEPYPLTDDAEDVFFNRVTEIVDRFSIKKLNKAACQMQLETHGRDGSDRLFQKFYIDLLNDEYNNDSRLDFVDVWMRPATG